MNRRQGIHGLVAWLCLAAFLASPCLAQGRGGPPGGGPGGGPGGPGGMGAPQFPGNGGPGGQPGGFPSMENIPAPSTSRSPDTAARSGLQLGPPDQRWWDDRSFVKSLKLRPDQQARMDAIFEQNRSILFSKYEAVRQAEAEMELLSKSSSPDEAALFAQIDRVSQARADLAKATTHMLLQIRKEMDPDQIKRLEKVTR